MPERTIEYVPLDDIVPALRNPKRHASDELQASVRRFGFTEPVLLDERTGRLIAGHGRLETLAFLRADATSNPLAPPPGVSVDDDGGWLVPVVRGWSSTDDTEAEAYLVASNRLVEAGGWDPRGLVDVLAAVNESAGLEGVGYSPTDLAELLAALAPPVPPGDFPDVDDDLPTDYGCPRCGYEWSGAPKSPSAADA